MGIGDETGKFTPVKFTAAIADHSQDNYSVSDAIDGDATKTGWAINIKGGKLNVSREAVFFPAQPLSKRIARTNKLPGRYPFAAADLLTNIRFIYPCT